MSRVQEPTFRCDCGKEAPVTRVTDYEFDVVCPCGWAYRLSWAHEFDPPVFAPGPRLPERAAEQKLVWD
jgi:hypothetical protein